MKKSLIISIIIILLLAMVSVLAFDFETDGIAIYKLDRGSGVVLDELGLNDGTSFGPTREVTGKDYYSFSFDGVNDYIDPNLDGILDEFSVSMWVKPASCDEGNLFFSNDEFFFGMANAITSCGWYFGYEGGTGFGVHAVTKDSWNHIVVVYNATGGETNYESYINNVPATSGLDSTPYNLNFNTLPPIIGARTYEGSKLYYFNGSMDEIYIYDRILTASEITELYNSGSGTFYKEPPVVTLNLPTDDFAQTSTSVSFNASAELFLGTTMQNMSLCINTTGSMVCGDTVTSTNETQAWDKTLSEGTYLWNVEACIAEGLCAEASADDTFTIDFTGPVINITSPEENSTQIVTGVVGSYTYPNLTLVVILEDSYLDSAWYEYNGANSSLTIISQEINETFNLGTQQNLTIYSNDTLGNINSEIISWDYHYTYENSTTFSGIDYCNDNTVTYTDLFDGTYSLNATACNIYGYCNTTAVRTFYVDTTFPEITYASNSDESNRTANFTNQDWIFVNVTYTELNEKNVTFTLWTVEEIKQKNTTYFGPVDPDLEYVVINVNGTPGGGSAAYSSSFFVGQTFTAPENFIISNLSIDSYRAGSPGNVTVEIYAVDGNDEPSGSALSTGLFDGDSLTTSASGESKGVSMSTYQFSRYTKYIIVFKVLTGDSSNKVWFIRSDNSDPYLLGDKASSSNGGSSWSFDLNSDLFFTLGGKGSYQIGTQDQLSFNINWTNLTENMYFWNVTLCDLAGNCNTTEVRNYGVEITTESLNLSFTNLIAELNSDILVQATNNLGTICVDIIHPEYGINFSCEDYATSFNITMNYFRNILFNNSDPAFIHFFVGTEIHDLFFPAHQYDEIDGMSFNITGANNPQDIQINKSNTSLVDRFYKGWLQGAVIFNNETSLGLDAFNITYSNLGIRSIDFLVDDNSRLASFIFNITGVEFGFEYDDTFDNESILNEFTNEGMFRGGFALPKGESLASFVYDAFTPAGAINSLFWTFYPNGVYGDDDGDDYEWTITNTYASDSLSLDVYMEEDYDAGERGSRIVNNYAYTNNSLFNIWSSQEISFSLEHYNYGEDSDSREECVIIPSASLGGVTFWTAPWQVCEDESPSDCNTFSSTIEPLEFVLKRNVGNSWNVSITGSEKTYGTEIDNDDCGSYVYTYNYTNGTYNIDLQYPEGSGCGITEGTWPLSNEKVISNLGWSSTQLKFNAYLRGLYDRDDREGCNLLTSSLTVSDLNHSLYSVSNSSIVSKTAVTSSGEIPSATLSMSECTTCIDANSQNSLTPYLSANGAEDWEGVTEGLEHSFTSPGQDIRYRYDFFMDEGYNKNVPFIRDMEILTTVGYPTNISFDFGNDGVVDWSFAGELNSTNSPMTVNVSLANISSAQNGTASSYGPHLKLIPLEIFSGSVGQINMGNFNLTYNPNPIELDINSILNYLLNSINFVNFPISIRATGGNIIYDDVQYDYAGGNYTFDILAHNDDYTQNVSRNLTYYYSRWDYEFVPNGVDWIYFSPRTPEAVNVTPYGQSALKAILNITNYGYGTYVLLKESYNQWVFNGNLLDTTENNNGTLELDAIAYFPFNGNADDSTANENNATIATAVISNMGGTSDWHNFGGGYVSENTTVFKTGSSLNWYTVSSVTFFSTYMNFANEDFTDRDFSYWVYFEDQTALDKINSLRTYVLTDASNYGFWSNSKSSLSVGWNEITINIDSPLITIGSFDKTDVSDIQLSMINSGSQTITEGEIILDDMFYDAALLTTDRFGNANEAYRFDNKDTQDKMYIADPDTILNLSEDFSFAFWMKSTNLQNYQYIFDNYVWRFTTTGENKMQWTVGRMENTTGPSYSAYSNSSLNQDEWYHVIGVYHSDASGGNGYVSLYLNGTLQGTTSTGSDTPYESYNDGKDLQWGNSRHGNAKPFEGILDDTIIFEKALTADQALGLYNFTASKDLDDIYTTGKISRAIDLDGALNYVDVGTVPIGLGVNHSMGGWINLENYATGNDREDQSLIMGGNHGSEVTLSINRDGRVLYRRDDPEILSTGVIQLNTWKHVFITYERLADDNVTSKIYIDGVLDTTNTAAIYSSGQTSTTMRIGYDNRFHNMFDGKLDDIRVYDVVLTDAQVSGLYNSGNGTEDLQLVESKKATLSIQQDEGNVCVNTTISLNNSKDAGWLITNGTWLELTNLSYLETTDIYLWADYDCNYSTWRQFQPNYYFRQCVDGGFCNTELI
ncbi:MAG: LamG domain-containing protein [Candidatus Heimdallarchaeaceae archaeon]